MPVGEVAGELLGGVFKFIGRVFIEIVVELIVKGSGYFICRIFSKRVDPDGILVVLVGLSFLGLLGYSLFWLYEYTQLQSIIDSCLDSGGRFDYEMRTCEH